MKVLQQPDGSNVMLVQSLQSFFYLIPYHCLSIWEALTRVHHGKASFGGQGAAAWSSLSLGAYLQSSFVSWFMTVADTSPWRYLPSGTTTSTLALVVVALAVYQVQVW